MNKAGLLVAALVLFSLFVPPVYADNPVVVITPCTAYELQCWLYPSFFIAVYLLMMMGIAYRGDISSRDMEGVVLEALAIGSLIAVIMGLFSVMIPLFITVLHIVRTLRA